jgi:hypothetical protein
MSLQIPNWYAPTFKTNVEALLQNPGNKLSDTVQHQTFTGEGARYINQYGQADAAMLDRPRNGDTPTMNVPMTTRWIYPETVTWATLIDNRDDLYSVVDPQSSIVSAATMEQQRQEDGVIVQALLGPAYVGKTSPVATLLPAANVLSTDIGGVASGLNVAKLRAAMKFLIKNFNDVQRMRVWAAITAEQWEDLLEDIQVTNKDYGGNGPLVDGVVRYFMGIYFKLIEYSATPNGSITLTNPATGAALPANNRVIPVYMADAVVEGTWRGLDTRITERPDKNFSAQVWTERVLGAARYQENKVVALTVTETP